MRPQIIGLILIVVLVSSPSIYAGYYEKGRYQEDAIEIDGKLIKVKIDSDASRVAYFWDDEAKGWVDVSQCQVDLNKAYSEKTTFQEMQTELNRMHDETWDDRYRY